MALHDYVCPQCGRPYRDQVVPAAIGATAGAPTCTGTLATPHPPVRVDWIPMIGGIDAGSGASFKAFSTEIRQPDGSYRPVEISSLHQLRQVERESEQRARNGEGQQLVWRDYAQDRSNGDRHTLGDPTGGESVRLSPEAKAKFGRPLRSAVEPEVTLGPGVEEASMSPLAAVGAGE